MDKKTTELLEQINRQLDEVAAKKPLPPGYKMVFGKLVKTKETGTKAKTASAADKLLYKRHVKSQKAKEGMLAKAKRLRTSGLG